MAVGNQASMGGLNAQLGSCAVGIRDTAEQITQLWSYVAALGADEAAQVTALEGLGFSPADAQAFWTDANYLYALSQLYYGQISQAAAFDYDSGLALARGAS